MATKINKKFPHYKQPDQMDCGPTCLRMIAKHYRRNYTLQRLREISGINRQGVSLLGISEAAEKIGFRTTGVRFGVQQLQEIDLPLYHSLETEPLCGAVQNIRIFQQSLPYLRPRKRTNPIQRGRVFKELVKYSEQWPT